MQTRNAIIISYGVPGIAKKQLKEAVETTLSFIKQVSDGEIETVKTFKP
jgi:DNA/RNA-binding domain of Phe-tRNA-synthetase-like protein